MAAITTAVSIGTPGRGRERFEFAIPGSEWTSPAHGDLTTTATTAPTDLRRFKTVTVSYVNETAVDFVVTPTPYVYSDVEAAWNALAASTAQTVTAATGEGYMLKPVLQDNSNDYLWAGDGVVWTVNPASTPSASAYFRIIVEGVLYDNAR